MKNLLTFKTRRAFEKWEASAEIVTDIGQEYFEPVYKKDEKYWLEDRETYNETNKHVCLKEVAPKIKYVPVITYHEIN